MVVISLLELRNVNSTLTTKDAKARLEELTKKVYIHHFMLETNLAVMWSSIHKHNNEYSSYTVTNHISRKKLVDCEASLAHY